MVLLQIIVSRRILTHGWVLSTPRRRPLIRTFAAAAGGDPSKKKKKGSSLNKFTINHNVTQANVDKLAAAFDELAKKDGFDSSSAIFADAEGFDETDASSAIDIDNDLYLDDDDDDDDEYLDFGGDSGESMEDRIAAAERNVIAVPDEMEDFAKDRTALRELGFRREQNPFGNDETPRQVGFRLVQEAMTCTACGSKFQSSDETKPGYLPPAKFETQVKLSQIENLQSLEEKAEADEWSPEDEIEWLLQTEGKNPEEIAEADAGNIDIDAVAEELGLDLDVLMEKKVICKRCHGLQNFGKVENHLRPGWTEEPMLSQERFRELLRPIREKDAVIVALVDIFDFSGSVLPELDNIAGSNPVILAANKADLLPASMGPTRVENWVRRELEYMGIQSLANIGGAVRLVSCKTGAGIGSMLAKARALAEEMDADIYVVGVRKTFACFCVCVCSQSFCLTTVMT